MKDSHIEWTDHTFNPWEGCTKVSAGCANCYAETRNKRFNGGANWGKGAHRRRTSEENWKLPQRWNRAAGLAEEAHWPPSVPWVRPRVFCASLADWLDDKVPIEWLADLLDLIRNTPNLDWLLLTKRPQNWGERVWRVGDLMGHPGGALARNWYDNGNAPFNVWLGTSVENQEAADKRIPQLLSIPAKVRFLSCEPLLSPVDLLHYTSGVRQVSHDRAQRIKGIDWVICGGESGPKARPFCIEWADDLRRQCLKAGVAFFMKQLGTNPVTTNANILDWPDHVQFFAEKDTPEAAGAQVLVNDRKGGDISEFPYELSIRQFPTVEVST